MTNQQNQNQAKPENSAKPNDAAKPADQKNEQNKNPNAGAQQPAQAAAASSEKKTA